MKFLHSGDWHLGKNLRALSRRDECEEALNEVLEIARREAVDCLLVAGDVFDTTTPSPEAEALLFEFLRELFGAGIPAVVIGGNHDHPKRLAAVSRVLELLKVHLRAEAVVPEGGGPVRRAPRLPRQAAAPPIQRRLHRAGPRPPAPGDRRALPGALRRLPAAARFRRAGARKVRRTDRRAPGPA